MHIADQEATINRVTVQPGCCSRCGAAYDACRAPISHGVPSINNIKLPPQIEAISAKYGRGETSKLLTSREREIFDAVAVMGYAHF